LTEAKEDFLTRRKAARRKSVLSEEILQARIDPAARVDSIGVMRNDDSHLPSGRRCITPLAIAPVPR
jgi:hypothetical protein